MAARLGIVLYWAGTLVAALILALYLFLVVTEPGNADGFVLIFGGGLAALVWLIGRAARFILAGD